MKRNERIQRLIAAIPELSNYRLQLVDRVVAAFQHPKVFHRDIESILIPGVGAGSFGQAQSAEHGG
jgi:hypothetical protein